MTEFWVGVLVGGVLLSPLAVVADRRLRNRNPSRNEKIARVVYRHLDDIIGATKHENQLRADARFRVIHKRRWFWWFVPAKVRESIADFFWPVPRIGPGVNPIPSDRRIAWYVQPSADLRTWAIRYSPEVAANHPQFVRYLTEGAPTKGGGLAQALNREWSPNLFQVERDWSAGLVRLTLNHKTDVPVSRNRCAEALT